MIPKLILPLTWTTWSIDPSVLVGVGLAAAGYVVVFRRYRQFPQRHLRMASAFAGLLIMTLALESPLDYGADHYFFFMHMTQHMLLTAVGAPLLLVALPAQAVADGERRWPWLGLISRIGSRIWIGAFMVNFLVLLWHVPSMYELALLNPGAHIVSHVCFIAAGMFMWWPVLRPLPDSVQGGKEGFRPLGKMLYLVLASTPMMMFAYGLALDSEVLYPFYSHTPHLWGISAAADQHIGGLIMITMDTTVCLIAMAIWFFSWFEVESYEDDRGHEPGQPAPAASPPPGGSRTDRQRQAMNPPATTVVRWRMDLPDVERAGSRSRREDPTDMARVGPTGTDAH